MELQDRSEELQASGLGVVAISYDSEAVLSTFAERRGITYPLLSDDDSAAITAFGILNTVAAEAVGPNATDPAIVADAEKYVSVFGASPMIVGTPFPGTFIVDADGRVTSRFFEEFYRERNTTSSIMLRLGTDMNPVAGVTGETAHLSITTSQSNPDISVGTKFSLVVDIEPKPGIHVYAPGAEAFGYRVIGLDITAGADDAILRAAPLVYTASEIYHFEPLDERVPVYQKPFRLIQDVVIEAHPGVEEALADREVITLSGQLDYQACDDSLCFVPVVVPLSWTVAVTQLDRQRAERR